MFGCLKYIERTVNITFFGGITNKTFLKL